MVNEFQINNNFVCPKRYCKRPDFVIFLQEITASALKTRSPLRCSSLVRSFWLPLKTVPKAFFPNLLTHKSLGALCKGMLILPVLSQGLSSSLQVVSTGHGNESG